MTNVLLVEDEPILREATQLALERHGLRVATAGDGLTALERFRAGAPDVIVLDIMLPHLDGVSVARRVREESPVPIVLVSARSDPIDVVQGLEAGADDYVTKPFDTAVLVARIRAVLRRAAPETAEADGPLRFGDLEFDTASMEVRRGGEPVALTPTELKLLLEFAARPGTVISRDSLLRTVWDYAWDGDSRVVDIHVQRLRAKIGKDRLETVRGFGYKLRR